MKRMAQKFARDVLIDQPTVNLTIPDLKIDIDKINNSIRFDDKIQISTPSHS